MAGSHSIPVRSKGSNNGRRRAVGAPLPKTLLNQEELERIHRRLVRQPVKRPREKVVVKPTVCFTLALTAPLLDTLCQELLATLYVPLILQAGTLRLPKLFPAGSTDLLQFRRCCSLERLRILLAPLCLSGFAIGMWLSC